MRSGARNENENECHQWQSVHYFTRTLDRTSNGVPGQLLTQVLVCSPHCIDHGVFNANIRPPSERNSFTCIHIIRQSVIGCSMANFARICAFLPALVILALSLPMAYGSGTESHRSVGNSSTLQMLTQLSEKLFTKLNSQLLSPHRAKARGYDSGGWGYMDRYSTFVDL